MWEGVQRYMYTASYELESNKLDVVLNHTAAAVRWVINKVYQQMTRH